MKTIFNTIKLCVVNTNYKIDWWFYKHSQFYIGSLNIFKCYREYREAKRYFVKPHWILTYSGKKNEYINDRCRILYFNIRPLDWKMKLDDPQFEDCPHIRLGLFNHLWEWQLMSTTYNYKSYYNTHEYWEPMLVYLYGGRFDTETQQYDRNICMTYQDFVWHNYNYSPEDIKNKKYDKPISITYFYIDNVLTTEAKNELREHGVKMHHKGIDTVMC